MNDPTRRQLTSCTRRYGNLGGGKFRKWLAVGSAWHDEHNEGLCEIEALPVNTEETATGYFRSVPVGKGPPAPLTVTREEFLEQQTTAEE